jgi:hypothetical protein
MANAKTRWATNVENTEFSQLKEFIILKAETSCRNTQNIKEVSLFE